MAYKPSQPGAWPPLWPPQRTPCPAPVILCFRIEEDPGDGGLLCAGMALGVPVDHLIEPSETLTRKGSFQGHLKVCAMSWIASPAPLPPICMLKLYPAMWWDWRWAFGT